MTLYESKAWIGVDLDGTLACYDGWKHEGHIGAPNPVMVELVKTWLDQGRRVKVFTARVSPLLEAPPGQREHLRRQLVTPIEDWCIEHIGQKLEVVCHKDKYCTKIYDDIAIQVSRFTSEQALCVQPDQTPEAKARLKDLTP